ncbi:MAG: hypothetical protein C0505_15840 [Leptothrix sp. (in: Bacteria)]|nr:hypothetical protein [Leptothrix sp. (in: b-proteobacteria)]
MAARLLTAGELATHCDADTLQAAAPPHETSGSAALARLVDHSARLGGDALRLDAGVRQLLDLLHEADHLARQAAAITTAAPARAATEAREVAAATAPLAPSAALARRVLAPPALARLPRPVLLVD